MKQIQNCASKDSWQPMNGASAHSCKDQMYLIGFIFLSLSSSAHAEFESCKAPRSVWIQEYKTQELDWIEKNRVKKGNVHGPRLDSARVPTRPTRR